MSEGTRHLTRQVFVDRHRDELLQIAGTGGWNTPDGRALDDERIDGAVAYANARVDGMVRGRYPQIASHPILTDAAIDIARYRLRSEANNATISDEVRKRHDDAIKLLSDIQAGRHALTDVDGRPLGTADGSGGTVSASVMTATPPRERYPDTLRGYR